MSSKDQAERPALSASIAKILIADTPLHAWTAHRLLNPDFEREEKEAFDLGTVAHAVMLEGESAAVIIDAKDWRTDAAKEARAEAYLLGKTPILRKHWTRVQDMVAAGKRQIAAHKEASDAFTDGEAEFAIDWLDDHGVRCKGRIDWIRSHKKRIFDYKTTGASANPEMISRMAVSQGWDIQSVFYLRGIQKLYGVDAQFFFVVQEDFEPFALSVVGMGPDFLWAGQDKVQRAIDTWAECLTSGIWPAYPDRIVYPTLPKWEESKIEERQLSSI